MDILVNTSMLYGGAARGCSCGKEALEIAQDWLPHLILYDGLLEGMRAWQFAAQYNNLPRVGPRPVMIALTGWKSTLMRRLCEEHGYDEYVGKPIELEQLLEWIRIAKARFKTDSVER